MEEEEAVADNSIVSAVLSNRGKAVEYIKTSKADLENYISNSKSPITQHKEIQNIFNKSVENIMKHHDEKDTFEVSRQRIGLCLDPDGKCTCDKPTTITDLLLNVIPEDKCCCEKPITAADVKAGNLTNEEKIALNLQPYHDDTIEELENTPLDISQLNLGPYSKMYSLTESKPLS